MLELEQPLWSMMGVLHGAGQEKPTQWPTVDLSLALNPEPANTLEIPQKSPLLLFTVI